MTLNAKQILSAKSKESIVKVETPEWAGDGKGFVYVRKLRASGYKTIKRLAQTIGDDAKERSPDDELESMFAWFVMTVCDENGEPIFTEEQVTELIAADPELAPLQRCADAAMVHNGFSEEEAEGRVKNS